MYKILYLLGEKKKQKPVYTEEGGEEISAMEMTAFST